MVLANKYDPFHACRFSGSHNLAGIEGGRVENRRIGIAIAPFLVLKGCRGEMNDRIKPGFLPFQLPVGRQRALRFRGKNGLGITEIEC